MRSTMSDRCHRGDRPESPSPHCCCPRHTGLMSDEAVRAQHRPSWARRIRSERLARSWSQPDAIRALRAHAQEQLPADASLLRNWKRWEAGELACGPVRRFVWAWSWCLVDRHRLRLCFAKLVRSQVRVTGGRPADLPLVLWARPTPAGERAWVWLRPGFSLEAMNDDIGRLMAVACIAKQVRIAGASDRFAAFVRVDIGRRDPLSGRIASPLALLIPSLRRRDADVPVSPAVPPVGLELADIEDLAPEKPRGGRR